MDDIIVRLIDLPHSVNGVTVLDEEGDYNVYINSRLSLHNRDVAYKHELAHIQEGHFYSDIPLSTCECEADLMSRSGD